MLSANAEQDAAVEKLKRFLSSEETNFLLLGPAGSGKTTTIVRAFADFDMNVMFCAFTNKATSVLQNITKKFNLSFNASFSTIHSLLGLQPKHSDKPDDICFEFRETAIVKLIDYDVIVFDECSTISTDLYSFIVRTYRYLDDRYGKSIKYIFLGDYWQIPPVGEKNGIVFATATSQLWPVSKIGKIMRSNNEFIYSINDRFLAWIALYKHDKNGTAWSSFIEKYPYNLIKPNTNRYVKTLDDLVDQYFTIRNDDSILLTHSKKSCDTINNMIQDALDSEAGRTLREDKTKITKFYPGDKCCLDKPITLTNIVREYISNDLIARQGEELPTKLYNGEIFDIVSVEDAIIVSNISKFSQSFHGQILTICRLNEPNELFELVFITYDDLKVAYSLLKRKLKKDVYSKMVATLNKYQPILHYGYCITIYKSQGSQWKNVLINMKNIWWSICGDMNKKNIDKKNIDKKNIDNISSSDKSNQKMLLFKLTYTAISRASDEIYLLW
jgi:hypothetical protein